MNMITVQETGDSTKKHRASDKIHWSESAKTDIWTFSSPEDNIYVVLER